MKITFLLLLCFLSRQNLMAQFSPNYDESKVPDFVLPDAFKSRNGDLIQNVKEWETIRRPEILSLFTELVYGQIPNDLDDIKYSRLKNSENPYSEIASLKEIEITTSRIGNKHVMPLKIFLPKTKNGPYPVFLLISHRKVEDLLADKNDEFFPVAEIISRGYAAAVFDVENVSPDNNERFTQGILDTLYPDQLDKSDGMRGLAAWAWGAIRAMDYLEKDSDIDAKRATVVGHSRGGKAALWAGANDTRWAVTVSNESGCGGAALSKREFGERIERINASFPFWFNENFKKFNGKEENLPIDQHQLIASLAPRAVYVSSAIEDQWADPKGEFLALKEASKVYASIYELPVDFSEEFENKQKTIHQPFVGYHLRDGKHNLNLHDWQRIMDFTDLHFRNLDIQVK